MYLQGRLLRLKAVKIWLVIVIPISLIPISRWESDSNSYDSVHCSVLGTANCLNNIIASFLSIKLCKVCHCPHIISYHHIFFVWFWVSLILVECIGSHLQLLCPLLFQFVSWSQFVKCWQNERALCPSPTAGLVVRDTHHLIDETTQEASDQILQTRFILSPDNQRKKKKTTSGNTELSVQSHQRLHTWLMGHVFFYQLWNVPIPTIQRMSFYNVILCYSCGGL